MMNPRAMVQRNTAQVQSLPAPVGGWNARDSYANMDPMDAITLVNMFPTVSNVILRGGYTEYCTGLDGQVQSLMNYSGGTTSELFAVTSTGKIYDVTAGGVVGAPVVTGLTSGITAHTNITTAGGSYLYVVNGVDAALVYDGSTWTAVATAGPSGIFIAGVNSNTLSNIVLFKNRLWFFQKDTLKAWYLPTNAISGTAQSFDLSAIARDGGRLVDFDAWTIDAGYGVDDNLAFATSNGELIVYAGTDPSSANTWALIGVWKLGSPIGDRSMFKWAGDLLILTYDGLLPMAASLQSSRLDPRVSLSNKIQGAITAATTAYGGNYATVGWQVFYNAKNNALWINVPVGPETQQQYVMNTITKSWCQFTGWAANVWETYQDDAYFGGNGFVALAWDTATYSDNGANIATDVIQAFNYFGSRGVKKYFTRARPSVFTSGSPATLVGVNVDFDISNNTGALTFTPTTYGTWDTAVWDTGLWGTDTVITNTWLGITGIGYCAAVQFKTASIGLQIEWASTDIVYQTGWAGV